MSGNINISNLSYKELQALALRYRVPGNIKKQLLIEVLQAARCGNEQQVDKLLTEMRQNRKKRVRKGKPTKLTMSLASTPIHSPTYDMADDYYAAQHRLPYQWVGAEEEIPNRQLDEVNRVPQYEEFRQFLLRRIQRDYQTYNTNHNGRVETVDSAGIMDLRNDQGSESARFENNNTNVGSVRPNNVVPMNSLESVQIAHNPSASGAFDYQILEDPNGNGNNASILLRRMLQAPVGADLGEIASPEQGSRCGIWGHDQYQNEDNLLDNSDTLSANSDINGNDNDDNCNWPVGTEYYRFVSNVRDQLVLNSGNVAGKRTNFDQPATVQQFCNVLTDNNPVQYQLLYTNQMPDVHHQQQQQQQQWEAPVPFDNDVLNYHQKPRNLHSSKMFPPGTNAYYDGISAANYASTRISQTDHHSQQQQQEHQYVNENGSGYSAGNQIPFEENNAAASTLVGPAYLRPTEIKFYENLNNNNNNTAELGNPTADVYPSMENSARQISSDPNDYTLAKSQIHQTNYYSSPGDPLQQTSSFIPPMQHLSFTNNSHNQQQPISPSVHNGYVENLGCANSSIIQTPQLPPPSEPPQLIDELNRPSIFSQYPIIHKVHSLVDENQELQYHIAEDQGEITEAECEGEGETENENKTILGSTSTTQSDSTISLDPFWPQKSFVKTTTSDNCLENILNLNTYGYVDYSKIDQTSCIYCYSAPIVTQKLYTGSNSPCSQQKKRFIAEFRQHTFSPYWLLYNDTNTGMQMSRNDFLQQKTEGDKAEEEPLAIVEEQKEEMTVINPVTGIITDVVLDLVNVENNLQQKRESPIDDLEIIRLADEEQLNSKITEEIITGDTDQCQGGDKMVLLESDVQMHTKSGTDASSNADLNAQNEIQEPSVNLNLENAGC